MPYVPILVAVAILAPQDPSRGREPSRPSPEPDRFDAAQDARVRELIGEHSGEPFDPTPGPQPPPLRPRHWRIVPDAGYVADRAARVAALTLERALPRADSPSWSTARATRSGAVEVPLLAAVSTIRVERSGVWFVRAAGAETVLVNGHALQGDPGRLGDLGVPVHLERGTNSIRVIDAPQGFELEFWKPMTRLVAGTWAANGLGAGVSLPVFNASLDHCHVPHFHYGRSFDPSETPVVDEWSCGGPILPLGMMEKTALTWMPESAFDKEYQLAPFTLYDESDRNADRRFLSIPVHRERPSRSWGSTRAWVPLSDEELRSPYGRCETTIVLEVSGDAAFDDRAASVARYWQQRYCYFRTKIPRVVLTERVPDPGPAPSPWSELAENAPRLVARVRGPDDDEPRLTWTDLVLVLGIDPLAPPGLLSIERDVLDGQIVISVRAGDAESLRRAYVDDPFMTRPLAR